MGSCSKCILGAGFLLLVCARVRADTLKITSNPLGATVEIDGVPAGTTPFEKDLPGGYFHRTKTSLGARLEHPMVARVSLAGYATKEISLTEGPMNWVGLNGRNHGEYWLLKSDHFQVDLSEGAGIWVDYAFVGSIPAKLRLAVGLHDIVVRSQGHADWIWKLHVLKDSEVTLSPRTESSP